MEMAIVASTLNNIFFMLGIPCRHIDVIPVERHGSGTTHGCTVYLRSEERPSHSDKLWVVAWNPLFEKIIMAVRLFHFPFHHEFALPLRLCFASSRSVHYLFERQGSVATHGPYHTGV